MPDRPTNRQTGGKQSRNVQQNVDDLSGGTVIGEQHNYYGDKNQYKREINWGGILGGLAVLLGLIFGALQLLPEQTRADFFSNLGLIAQPTATSTATLPPTSLATTTPIPTTPPAILPATPAATMPVPTLSPTQGYPCDGTIVFTTGALLNQVKVIPQKNAPGQPPVQQGSTVQILAKQTNDGITWYQITYNNGANTGWIPDEYVTPSANCPQA